MMKSIVILFMQGSHIMAIIHLILFIQIMNQEVQLILLKMLTLFLLPVERKLHHLQQVQ